MVNNVNAILDHLAELGSKCIFLEAKWNRLSVGEQQARLQEANHLFTEFEFLQYYLQDNTRYSPTIKGIQNYVLAGQNEVDQQIRLVEMRKDVESMYLRLIDLNFNDQSLFVALLGITDQLKEMEAFRKTAVLNGMAKALLPFQAKNGSEKYVKAFEQVSNLCTHLELIKSEDVEGLYILSLQSAIEEIETSWKALEKSERILMI